jgi:MoaA/NifB/PqqE/SkfB family radical SAM enzyme
MSSTPPSGLQKNAALDALHQANVQLSEVEYSLRRLYLHSMPRYLTIVISDRCNIDCPHCYQAKTGDNLLADSEINPVLRREFSALYPYLSTLRLQGGEVFAIRGFCELVEDVASSTDRPLISISTNGTLIDQAWAERIVRTPFQSITVSFDGGTQETFEKLRRGARFPKVIENISRLQELKKSIGSSFPELSAFFVLMRSNYREIPEFLALMKNLGIYEVAFTTMEINPRNLTREPGLVNEVIKDAKEVHELYSILQQVMAEERPHFRQMMWNGLHSLFEHHGLDPFFLDEESAALYPDHQPESEGTPAVENDGKIKLCPNPWSLMFVVENGDVLLCFLSSAVGNLYESPLVKIWNSPRAIAKRSEMIDGRYLASGCSEFWCDWRDGKTCTMPTSESRRELLEAFKLMRDKVAASESEPRPPELPLGRLGAVRRLLESRERRILELEASLADLVAKDGLLHETGQAHIDHLEKENRELQSHTDHSETQNREAQSHIDHIEKQNRELRSHLDQSDKRHRKAEAYIDHIEKQNRELQSHIDHLETRKRELLAKKQRLAEKTSALTVELKSLKQRPHWPRSWLTRFRDSKSPARKT